MEQIIRFELPDGVAPSMPFSGSCVITPEQAAQVRIVPSLPPGVLEVARIDDVLQWRHRDKIYTTPLSNIRKALVGYGTFGAQPFLEFVLMDQPDGGCLLMTFFVPKVEPGQTELGRENWFRDFARQVGQLIPGGVKDEIVWPLKN